MNISTGTEPHQFSSGSVEAQLTGSKYNLPGVECCSLLSSVHQVDSNLIFIRASDALICNFIVDMSMLNVCSEPIRSNECKLLTV